MAREPIPGTHEPGYVEQQIKEEKVPEMVRQALLETLGLRVFSMGECSIIIGRERAGGLGAPPLWHLSISHPSRHPTWDEIKTARYRLIDPNVCMAMFLPPPWWYVNLEAQDHVFQMWETVDPNEPWKDNR